MKAQTDQALLRRLRAAWERQAQRIDALSLRERSFLFLSLLAVLAALFDTLVLSPHAARTAQRREEAARHAAELGQMRDQFVAASQGSSDPVARLRRQLDGARTERARLDEALRRAGSASAGEGLAVVLQRLLAQQPGLVLERLRLLDDAPVAGEHQPALDGLSWQGVELQVQGGYHDVQRYLQALERELPGLRWGQMRLSAGGGNEASRLQAELFLLKVHP
ncbi:hypothetical protein [Roseateles sp.]|uniref:hypothetical protein n=1 Tax=Roseateles sp. TaxID=1971397 RepID=UPI0025F242CB|nr:hypothetical protein [Roseateles sp.]MBV8035721.1 hypothetical protein [Roseateles sp.]